MYQDTTITMPKQFMNLTAEEMTETEGGYAGAPIAASRSMLSKDYCYSIAQNYVNSSYYNPEGLGRTRIAKELYAHASLYYYGVPASLIAGLYAAAGLNLALAAGAIAAAKYLAERGCTIELGGDNSFRVLVYNVLW